ncbi:MAG: hypothetical protein WCO56_05810 [Verrucomicrobiota bacterium]
MVKGDRIKQNSDEFLHQLVTFDNNIAAHAAALGVTTAQMTAHHNDTLYFEYVLGSLSVARACAAQWTTWKDLVSDGGTPSPAAVPTPPLFPAAAPVVDLNIKGRFRVLVQNITNHPGYNEAIGKVLGIEGSEITPPDYDTLQPDFKLSLRSNGVYVHWNFGHYGAFLDQCKIVVDRGDGKGEVLLTIDNTAGYLDTTPFPATPAKWTYRAVYMAKDQQVGQWSKPVTINVG